MRIISAAIFALISTSAFAQVAVEGHITKNGVYVPPHQRTAPNATIDDNYSTKGNINPYTGKAGTVPRQPEPYQYTPPPPPPAAKVPQPSNDLYKPIKPLKF